LNYHNATLAKGSHLFKSGILVNLNYLFLAVILTLLSSPAHAYIDPGSGSAIMGAIVGLFVAISLAVKTYWYKLKALFTGASKTQSPPENPAKNDE
jgi:hypothetical protein